MKNYIMLVIFFLLSASSYAQSGKNALKFNLNDSGTTYIQATILNQTWIRFNENNPGTLVQGKAQDYTFDIGLRRTRIQLLGQISKRVFLYFQFGQNNFNALYSGAGNRKFAAFFHDAVCEYRFTKNNELKVGAGLTIANGLSRFSQPSIGTIMTMDVPVFAQSTVDQTDLFSRKLSIYARGQIWKIDYRIVLSNPFPVNTSGQSLPAISQDVANFAQKGQSLQGQAYLIYQFFDHESHTTPYMTGTHLGSKKIFNIAVGAIYQNNAMWKLGNAGDTLYQAMRHFAVESYLDIPINRENKSAISAYLGYYNLNYGTKYLRYNGIMNPANGSNATNSISGQGPTYGNSLPMFGSGHTIYTQFGYVLPDNFTKGIGRLMPYCAATLSKYDYFDKFWTNTFNVGINYFINDHKSKITVDWQNRPNYYIENGEILSGKRLNTIVLQYQIFF
jgi:hypothetical protein